MPKCHWIAGKESVSMRVFLPRGIVQTNAVVTFWHYLVSQNCAIKMTNPADTKKTQVWLPLARLWVELS